jgi:hypothetical protein
MQERLQPDLLPERARSQIEANTAFAVSRAIVFEQEVEDFNQIDKLLAHASDFFHDYYVFESNVGDEKHQAIQKATVTVSNLDEFKYLIKQAHRETMDSITNAFKGQIASLDSIRRKSEDIFQHEKSHAEVAIGLGRKTTYNVLFTRSLNGIVVYMPHVSFGEKSVFSSIEDEIKYLEENIKICLAPKTKNTKLGMSAGDTANVKQARNKIIKLKSK